MTEENDTLINFTEEEELPPSYHQQSWSLACIYAEVM